MRSLIAALLLGCSGSPEPAINDASVSDGDARADLGVDTRRDLGTIVTDTAPPMHTAPARTPCELPKPGPTKCAAGGCPVEIIAKGQTVVSSLVDGGTELWFTIGSTMSPAGSVKRMSKSTFAMKTVGGGNYPSGIALSDTEIFWANFDNTPSVSWGAIRTRTREDVSAPSTILVANEPQTQSLTYAGGSIYWSRLTGGLYRVPSTGGMPKLVLEGAGDPVVAENDLVFFDGFTADDVWLSKMPVLGGSVTRLSSVRSGGIRMAWSAGYAVWTDETLGTVARACTDLPGEAKYLVTALSRPVPIAIRDGWVYFAERASNIKRVPLAGGTPVVLATGARNVSSIVADDDWVYWSDFDLGTISRTPR